jgi:hypothetical protein
VTKILIGLLFCAGLFAQQVNTVPIIPPPLPPIPALTGNFSLIFATGVPTTTPRHFAGALGIGYTPATSPDQTYFGTLLLAPQPGTNLEQASMLVGMSKSMGTTTIAGKTMKSWASVSFGAALKNVSVNTFTTPTTLTPAGIITSISTNPKFTAQYVFGFGYNPTWCKNTCETGPLGKYVTVVGEPKQFLVGWYFDWKIK